MRIPKNTDTDKNHFSGLRIKLIRLASGFVLITETLKNTLWRIFFWSLFFAGIFMLEIPAIFSEAGSYSFWSVYVAGVLYLFYQDRKNFKWPRLRDIDRRIERESGIFHRPLSENKDAPASKDQGSDIPPLWIREQARRSALVKNLKIPQWRLWMAAADPYALRLMALLLAFCGFIVAGQDWDNRLRAGFIPFILDNTASNTPAIIVTITPPEYTALGQIVLQGGGNLADVQNIPTESSIKVHVNTALGAPYASIGPVTRRLDDLGDNTYGLEDVISNKSVTSESESETLRFTLSQYFINRLSFDYKVIPDEPPRIAMQLVPDKEKEKEDQETIVDPEPEANPEEIAETEPVAMEPQVLEDGQIQIPLVLHDDYGVKNLRTRMNLDPLVEDAPIGYAEDQTRSIMSSGGKDFNTEPVFDFTDNPWAGLPVRIDITAEDLIGQITALKTIEMILPERDFKHPVAKKLVALRKKLAWEPLGSFDSSIKSLEDILKFPEDFQNDPIVFLAIRVTASRLNYNTDRPDTVKKETIKTVMALLWDTALRVEDGNISLAARNLRQAQMDLEDAVRDPDLSDTEISALMIELKAAMDSYLLELQKELQKKLSEGENLPMLSPERLAEMIDPQALDDFMRQMQSEMMEGDTKSAQNMLSQLQRLLDLLNPNMTQPMPEDMQAMQDGINELQQLIDNQQQLMDQTLNKIEDMANNLQQGFGNFILPDTGLIEQWGLNDLPPPPSRDQKTKAPEQSSSLNKTEQEALRFILGQLMIDTSEALGEIPKTMGLAEQEMRMSALNLGLNKPGQSVPHQKKAIEYLKDAQDELDKKFQQRMQQMAAMGMALNGGQPPGGGRYDPLGRPYGRAGEDGPQMPGSRVKIPDEAQRKRVEEILRLLRQRSGELDRPREELEYFERLLRQF